MAAARPATLVPFKEGYNEIPRPIPQSTMARVLAVASTAESITPPAGARRVIFSYTSNTFVNCYATATVPADTTDGTASELNPSGYELNPNELPTISVISAVAGAIVTAAFYA
jgi:hypothetical protein